ncbi:MurR/RpiR family transcriptional regulator [Oryzibacter oryziterrae]|uniref:MurR/RpiR family transcriptional regulator n=1 Tax=Oryzibacter oryziterrae TaxID=2766474 RepID=UPI001F3398FF|nr:MurR/RpiR family transcriptional regulator [Oryzibacter oryziterrae]
MKRNGHASEAKGAGDLLRRRIDSNLASPTRTETAIASYFVNEIATLPFETAGSVATKIGVSEASVGRFCRAIGFRHFKELKASLRDDFGDRAWLIGDRLREFAVRSQTDKTEQALALEKEIAAVVANHELAATPIFRVVARRLALSARVFVAGFQTERGHAQFLANGLGYLRPGVRLLDTSDGHFAEVLVDAPQESCLVLIDGRRYSRLTRQLALAARAAGVPVTLITDPYCDWAYEAADEVLVVQTDLNQFWDATSAMSSLAGLLINAVFNELGPEVEARMTAVSALYADFIGHTPAPGDRGPEKAAGPARASSKARRRAGVMSK